MDVEDGEIRLLGEDHLDCGCAVGALSEDAKPLSGAEGRNAFPNDGMVVGEHERRTIGCRAHVFLRFRWYGDLQCSSERSAANQEFPPQVGGVFANGARTDARRPMGRSGQHTGGVEPDAVVLDDDPEAIAVGGEGEVDAGGPGMADDIREGFLGDSIDQGFDFRIGVLQERLDVNGAAKALGDAADIPQMQEGRVERKTLPFGRMEPAADGADLVEASAARAPRRPRACCTAGGGSGSAWRRLRAWMRTAASDWPTPVWSSRPRRWRSRSIWRTARRPARPRRRAADFHSRDRRFGGGSGGGAGCVSTG